MNYKFLFACSYAVILLTTACKKDNPSTPVTPVNTNPVVNATSTYFAPSDAFGLLVAGNFGGATILSAQFFNSAAGSRAIAGSVDWNGNTLTQGGDSAYSYFSFSNLNTSGSLWNIIAGTVVPAFTATYPDFPSLPVISSSGTISRAAGFTVTFSPVTGADSIYVTITGSASKSKLIAGSSTSCDFSAADFNALSATSSGQVNVGAWNRYMQSVSSKNYYFYNNSSTIQSVVIQ